MYEIYNVEINLNYFLKLLCNENNQLMRHVIFGDYGITLSIEYNVGTQLLILT